MVGEQFEYKIVRATSLRKRSGAQAQEDLLNRLAAEGWELVTARFADAWDWKSEDTLILRRARPA